MKTPRFGSMATYFATTFVCAVPALGASHSWRINEIFSNASGTVQFIELKEAFGNTAENGVNGKTMFSVGNNATFYTITANVSGNTASRHLLFATAAFAALPGAPTPNYIIAPNSFVKTGDTIQWAPVFGYHTFPLPNNALPLDGINSLRVTNYNTNTFTTGPNTPTNYANQSGSVNAACLDNDGDGYGNPGDVACSAGPQTDCNDANINVNPGESEVCTDSLDNNCDSLTDCEDAVTCNAAPCVPTVSEVGAAIMGAMTLIFGGVVLHKRKRALAG